MTLLDNHLEQISLSSAAIAELPFPAPKVFTNAILHSHDITALIRDTESHERALFTLAAAEEESRPAAAKIARRSTVYGLNGTDTGATSQSRGRRSAAVALLGRGLGEQVRKQQVKESGDRDDVDVQALLEGAEKLCAIYPIAGASDKISSLRWRYEQLSSSISHYEAREGKQMNQLAKMNKKRSGGGEYVFVQDDDDDEDVKEVDQETSDAADSTEETNEESLVTEEDLRQEEEEIRILEEKKRALEDRVAGMERDLGGLLR